MIFWDRKSKKSNFFNFFIKKSCNFISNLNDHCSHLSFEVTCIMSVQLKKLQIAEFLSELFFAWTLTGCASFIIFKKKSNLLADFHVMNLKVHPTGTRQFVLQVGYIFHSFYLFFQAYLLTYPFIKRVRVHQTLEAQFLIWNQKPVLLIIFDQR